MSLHLLSPTSLLAGYESGNVVLHAYEGPSGGVTDARLAEVMPSSAYDDKERGRWVVRWKAKVHNEAGQLPLLVCPFRLQSWADQYVGRV
jgi:hypothetical protein